MLVVSRGNPLGVAQIGFNPGKVLVEKLLAIFCCGVVLPFPILLFFLNFENASWVIQGTLVSPQYGTLVSPQYGTNQGIINNNNIIKNIIIYKDMNWKVKTICILVYFHFLLYHLYKICIVESIE